MVEQQLPTKEELETLYKVKGHKAIVWYAWRASLRAMPFLAMQPLKTLWSEQAVPYCYAATCVNILLSQYVPRGDSAAYASASVSSASAARAASYYAASAARASASSASAAAATSAAAAAAAAASAVAASTVILNITSFIISDYEWLTLVDDEALSRHWHRSLWENSSALAAWLAQRDVFIEELNALGLGFIGVDLMQLWQGKPVGKHVENYFKDHSETITNDADKLRKAILGEEATQKNEAFRLLLLGPGGAGKTSLADLMLDRNETKNKAATVGIELTKFERFINYYPKAAAAYSDLQFSLWDFGGQAIFHGLHQTFLHENCVYLLVVDSRHEQAPDPWLHQIRASSNGNAKVLLITNVYEHCWAKRNETRLMREFPDLLEQDAEKGITSFYYFACNQDSPAYQNFIHDLVNVCAQSRKQIFTSTAKAIVKLTKQFENDSTNDAVLFIDKDELAENYADFDDEILPDLEELGHVVRSSKDNLCLNPNLVTKYCYQILNDRAVIASNGYVPFSTIKTLSFREDPIKLNKNDRELLLDFMVKKKLACESSIDEDYYFFPDAANSNEPETVREYLSQPKQFTLLFDLSYLPNGMHTHLISSLFNNEEISIYDHNEVWRHGFILRDKQSNALAVVQYYLTKSVIEFTLVGEPVNRYSQLITQFTGALSGVGKGVRFNTYWVYDNKAISIELSDAFIDVLKGVNGYSELIKEAKGNMTQVHVHGDNNQVNTGANAEQHKDSHNVSITQNDMNALALIMQEAMSQQDNQELASKIEQVQMALQKPEIPENKSLLAKVWDGLKSAGDVVGTIDNLQKATAFVTLHMPLVISALS